MPVTAKLSRIFHERMGDQVANELVDWLNAVDHTYRLELKSLNELNFARFDAKVDQRFAEADAKWEQRFAEADMKLERRFAEADAKWERRLADLEVKWERRFAELETRIAQLDARIDVVAKGLIAEMDRRAAEQIRWFFLAWATLGVGIVGLWFRT
ncbi:MAG: hypothetical protein HY275_12515 [Gemmatimonadetes bacterium]|nr:hypothetical protein [Gemmatimonadota bacterium]